MGLRSQCRSAAGGPNREGVKEVFVHNLVTGSHQGISQPRGLLCHVTSDALQALGAVVHRKHSRHDGQENLGGANVAGRLVATNVLFAGLEGQAVGGISLSILRDTNQAARELALQALLDGQVSSVRTPKAQGNTEALSGSRGDVSTHLTGRAKQSHRQKVRCHNGESPLSFGRLDHGAGVPDATRGTRVLNKRSKVFGKFTLEICRHNLNPEGFCATRQDSEGLSKRVSVHQEHIRRLPGGAPREKHRFGHRGALIEHGGISGVQAGEVRDHGLEIQQCLQAALRDFWLVGGVGGVPARVFQNGALDHRGCVGAVVALSEQGPPHRVGIGKRPQLRQGF